MSKPVVARYVLRLASEGALDLDEPLDIDLASLRAVADPRWGEFACVPGSFCYSGEGFAVLLHALTRGTGQPAAVRADAGQVAWQQGDNLGFKHIAGLRRSHGDGVVVLTNGDGGKR